MEGIEKSILAYDEGLIVYGEIIVTILNRFMHHTRPLDWDGPEPIMAGIEDGMAILDEWAIQATSTK